MFPPRPPRPRPPQCMIEISHLTDVSYLALGSGKKLHGWTQGSCQAAPLTRLQVQSSSSPFLWSTTRPWPNWCCICNSQHAHGCIPRNRRHKQGKWRRKSSTTESGTRTYPKISTVLQKVVLNKDRITPLPRGAGLVGRGPPLQPKGAGLSGATRQRVGFPLKILD